MGFRTKLVALTLRPPVDVLSWAGVGPVCICAFSSVRLYLKKRFMFVFLFSIKKKVSGTLGLARVPRLGRFLCLFGYSLFPVCWFGLFVLCSSILRG